jgi:hypothetical protein
VQENRSTGESNAKVGVVVRAVASDVEAQ